MFCLVKIHINGKFVNVKAIIDTGNFLKEPITKTPVVVVEKQALMELVPNYILDNIDKIINGENIDSFFIILKESLPREKLALEIRINCYPKKISMKEQYFIMQEIETLHYKPFEKA